MLNWDIIDSILPPWTVEGARPGLAYAFAWAATVLLGHSEQIVMTDTVEVPAMRGVWRDARQRALQLHKPPVFPQAKLNKPA